MAMIISRKKRKELAKQKRQQQLEQERMERMMNKAKTKKTLRSMQQKSKSFDAFKKSYIQKAQSALKSGNETQYNLAKSGLKIAMAKQKILDSMIINFELVMETNEMNRIVSEFVDGIKLISTEMKQVVSNEELMKAQHAFDEAMTKNAIQYESFEQFMDMAVSGFERLEVSGELISDDEINQLITNQVVHEEEEIDTSIELKLTEIRSKISDL